jgi:solute carrier family 25 oxoglutarate transporter 11
MQVDEMYPEQARRNYRNLFDGLSRVAEEGALWRGCVANGLKIAMLTSTITGLFDLSKENSYYFFGPHWINRIFATVVAALIGTLASMPFDMIRTRLHTMRPLPTGQYPYNGTCDCLVKVTFVLLLLIIDSEI